jgi:hypothetical protein
MNLSVFDGKAKDIVSYTVQFITMWAPYQRHGETHLYLYTVFILYLEMVNTLQLWAELRIILTIKKLDWTRFQEPYLYKNSRSTRIRAALGAQILVLREI